MTMTDLNGKIEDTIIALNEIKPRRSFSDDERFLSNLITSYRELQKDRDTDVEIIEGYIGLVEKLRESQTKDRATIKELLEALKPLSDLWKEATPEQRKLIGKTIETAHQVYTKHSTDTDKTKGDSDGKI